MSGLRGLLRARHAGFTLLELLIAVTLVAMLSVLMLGGLRFGTRVWERSNRLIDGDDDVTAVRDLLREGLSNSAPVAVGAGRAIAFDGRAGAVRFLAPLPKAIDRGDLGSWSLLLSGNPPDASLVLQWRPERAGSGATATERAEPLLDHVAALQFAYFGERGSENVGSWHEDWRDSHALPKLIRVRVAFKDGDLRAWPDLIIAPQLDVDAQCIFDPLTRYCRGRLSQ